jgi:hypothetical protein
MNKNTNTARVVRNLANLAAGNVRNKRSAKANGLAYLEGTYSGKAFAYALSAKHVWNMAKIDGIIS